jgi:hypothetical protein
MIALTSDLNFAAASIATCVAAILLTGLHFTLAGDMGARSCIFIVHMTSSPFSECAFGVFR